MVVVFLFCFVCVLVFFVFYRGFSEVATAIFQLRDDGGRGRVMGGVGEGKRDSRNRAQVSMEGRGTWAVGR